jgi:hypothetical protein
MFNPHDGLCLSRSLYFTADRHLSHPRKWRSNALARIIHEPLSVILRFGALQ